MSGVAKLDDFFEKENIKIKYSKECRISERNKQFYWTGHPFVDAGLTAILLITNKKNPEEITEEDVKKAIEFVSKLYAKNEWASKYLHGMIFPNSGILMANPGIKGSISRNIQEIIKKEGTLNLSSNAKKVLFKKLLENFDEELAKDVLNFLDNILKTLLKKEKSNKEELKKVAKEVAKAVINQEFVNTAIYRKIKKTLINLYNNIPEILNDKNIENICVICGRRRPAHDKYNLFMSVFPLLGTGGMLNFFHSANPKGADICAHCLFLVQFMPVSAYLVGRVLLIHAYPYEKMLELCKEAVNDVKLKELASDARGFKRPVNFFFRKVAEITQKVESGYKHWENVSVTLYYFICNNQNQDIDVIPIPNPVLRFIAFASADPTWKDLLNTGWHVKKEKKEKSSFEELEKGYTNEIYRKLLNYESILPYFYDKRERKVNASWRLLKFYCVEVLGLDEKALEFIKSVGDRIVETIENLPNNQLRRTVRELENATRLWEFENFFIRVEKIRQNLRLPNALLTFDEFARLLTAYGEDINVSWKTVRDLLLFRIYERLHDRLSGVKEELEEEEFEYWRG